MQNLLNIKVIYRLVSLLDYCEFKQNLMLYTIVWALNGLTKYCFILKKTVFRIYKVRFRTFLESENWFFQWIKQIFNFPFTKPFLSLLFYSILLQLKIIQPRKRRRQLGLYRTAVRTIDETLMQKNWKSILISISMEGRRSSCFLF